MKYFLSATLMLSFFVQSVAQEIDNIYSDYEMKDGSIYTGYISRQSFIDKTVTLTAVSAMRVMDKADVSINSTLSMTPISALEEKMQNWLKKHPNFVPNYNSKSTVPIVKIEDLRKQHIYHDALLIQRGAKVKFLTCDNEIINIPTDDIVKLTKPARHAGVMSGVIERFSTKVYEEDIKGQVVCQDMRDGTINILDDLGYTFSIKSSDVTSRSEILIDPELPYTEQCPFIETVHTKDATYCGFISKQVFGTKFMPGYLHVQTDLNQVERVEYPNIREITRRLNEEYKPIVIPEISDDDYYVCDSLANPCTLSKIPGNEDGIYYVSENKDSSKSHLIISVDNVKDGVKVQLKSSPKNKNIIFVPLKKSIEKKNVTKYSFTLQREIFAKDRPTTKHGIDTFVYEVDPVPGNYVLFRKDIREAVWIEIR